MRFVSRPAACHARSAIGTAICRTTGITKSETMAYRAAALGGLLFDVVLYALDFDRAVLQERNDGADRRENRRDKDTNHTRGQRKLGDRPALVIDDDTPDVAFVNHPLQLLEDCLCVTFERFPCAGH